MRNLRTWALGALCLAAAGCARDAASPREASPLTDARARELGRRLAAELGASLGAMTPGRPVRGAVAAAGPLARGSAAGLDPDAACPDVSNPADSDGDGVPDDAVLVFALPGCRFINGPDTLEITGTARLVDPVPSPPPNPAAFGYVASFDHLRLRFAPANPDSGAVETRTGTEALFLTPERLTQGHGFSISRADRNGIATIEDAWSAMFTPDAGTTLVPGQALPSGAFVLAGRSTWTRGGQGFAFEIGTAVPLRYDASCPEQGPNRFRAGEVHARVTVSGQQVLVRVVFADCDEPMVIVVRP